MHESGQSEWAKGVLHVNHADRGRVPSWIGFPPALLTRICQTILDVLLPEKGEARWFEPLRSARLLE